MKQNETQVDYLTYDDEAIRIARTMYQHPEKRQRVLPEGTDIIKEYELIQRKASTLSRWERDQVVKIFEHNFKAI
jgi:hypothetical protein